MFILSLTGCGNGHDANTLRYKMTVEVDTPQGVKRGHAVREVTYRLPAGVPMFGEDRGGAAVDGEAVAVRLPDGAILYALLTGADGDADYAQKVPALVFSKIWNAAYGRQQFDERTKNYERQPGDTDQFEDLHRLKPVEVIWPPSPAADPILPMLARFRDPTNPTSIERVNPDELSKAFGKGVELKRILVEITDEKVTVGVTDMLPDFGNKSGFDKWYKSLPYGDPRRIGMWEFKRGKTV